MKRRYELGNVVNRPTFQKLPKAKLEFLSFNDVQEDIMTMDRNRQAGRGSRDRNATSDSVERSGFIDHTIDREAQGNFLDQTIAVWQPYADRSLTREDAREIAHNVVGFFCVLREWAEEERRSTASAELSLPAQLSGTQSNLRP